MIPVQIFELARVIHEERIRAALAPRPEFVHQRSRQPRSRPDVSVSRQVRISVAQALRRMAASVEPSGSILQGSPR